MQNLDKAVSFGIDTMKGCLITGMPGCGKTSIVKSFAKEYGLPLICINTDMVIDNDRVGQEKILTNDFGKTFSIGLGIEQPVVTRLIATSDVAISFFVTLYLIKISFLQILFQCTYIWCIWKISIICIKCFKSWLIINI